MTDAVKPNSIFATPAMSVESEPELELETTPVRWSGLIALLLGICSFSAVLGAPLLIVPIVATLVALFALRPYSGDRPVGYTPALIGLFLAVVFGFWGESARRFKYQYMSTEATHFAKEWLNLVGQGDLELALELQIHPSRRQPESMPLADYYHGSEPGINALSKFKEQEVMPTLIEVGSHPKWELVRPPSVILRWGRDITETVWNDTTGSYSQPLKIELEYLRDEKSDKAQWKIERVSTFMEDVNRV